MAGKTKKVRGVTLMATLFLLVVILASLEAAFLSYHNNLTLNKFHSNSLQVLYYLKAAKAACLWEEAHAKPYFSWDTLPDATYDSTCRLSGSNITNGFYTLAGYNFRFKTTNADGTITTDVHGFQGTPEDPKYSRYVEFIYSLTPLYEYFHYTKQGITFKRNLVNSGGVSNLYNCAGGKIYADKDIEFQTPDSSSPGIILNNISELIANGTIKYGQRFKYPAPYDIDKLDAYDENGNGVIDASEWANATTVGPGLRGGMAPAPYAPNDGTAHYASTTGVVIYSGGPFRNRPPDGVLISKFGYGHWLGGDSTWGYWKWAVLPQVNAPLLWRGSETMFYGRQANGINYDSNTSELGQLYVWDGGSSAGVPPMSALQKVYRYSLSGSDLAEEYITNGQYYVVNVLLKPYKNNNGDINPDVWFDIPGALPQNYLWENKYANNTGVPVNFYATQSCSLGSAGCIEADILGGWRYIKKKPDGTYCSNNTCYNNTTSTYVLAQEYTGYPYFSNIQTLPEDSNDDVLLDANYTYGNDIASPPYIKVFDSQKQNSTGFPVYLSKLAAHGFSNIITPNTQKDLNVGQIFNKPGQESRYCTIAKENGIYIDSSNLTDVITKLGTNPGTGSPVAKIVNFYNWRTGRQITALNIDIYNMKAAGTSPMNGIIYSSYPLRLSSANNLPGINSGNKKAIFTVICEESIYLQGNYNTDDWKLSNIATKKIIYALSNSFIDQTSSPDVGEYVGFPNSYDIYPYVYLMNISGNYTNQEGSPSAGNGGWVDAYSNQTLQASGVNNATVRTYAISLRDAKQSAWILRPYHPPNTVLLDYTYNSLFLTPYKFGAGTKEGTYDILTPNYTVPVNDTNLGSVVNYQLESWDWWGNRRTIRIYGSFINLYDPNNPSTDYYAPLGPEEDPFFNRVTDPNAPPNPDPKYLLGGYYGGTISLPIVYQEYDSRFPQAKPQSYEAILGLTGPENVFRQVSQEYFNLSTQ